MPHRLLLAASLLALLPGPALAQAPTPDTTSAWRYAPLAVGDAWEYEVVGDGEGFERRTVAADTLIAGVRYVRYEQQRVTDAGEPVGARTWSYVRFDTLATAIAWWEGGAPPPTDLLPGCALGASFGSETACSGFLEFCVAAASGAYDATVVIGDDTVATSVKKLDTGPCEAASTFGAGLGLLHFATLGGTRWLRYAWVGSVEYGEPLVVDTEAGPSPRAPTLDVFPNPSRRRVTVALRQQDAEAVEVAVYDVRGRRVALLHAGPLAVGTRRFVWDATDLPAGTYVVRAAGERTATALVTLAR